MRKKTIKTVLFVMMLQFSANIFSAAEYDDHKLKKMIADYKAGNLEVIPNVLKEIKNFKESNQKKEVLDLLGIRYNDANKDAEFEKVKNDLKDRYFKSFLSKSAGMPKDLIGVLLENLKKFKIVAAFFNTYHDPVTALVGLDGNKFVLGGFDGAIRIYDSNINKPILSLFEPEQVESQNAVKSFAKLDDNRLASASENGMVQIWDLKTNKLIETLEGHKGSVNSLVPLNGNRLASGGQDGTVRVWDLKTNKLIETLIDEQRAEGELSAVMALTKLYGNILVAGHYDGAIKIWKEELDFE